MVGGAGGLVVSKGDSSAQGNRKKYCFQNNWVWVEPETLHFYKLAGDTAHPGTQLGTSSFKPWLNTIITWGAFRPHPRGIEREFPGPRGSIPYFPETVPLILMCVGQGVQTPGFESHSRGAVDEFLCSQFPYL